MLTKFTPEYQPSKNNFVEDIAFTLNIMGFEHITPEILSLNDLTDEEILSDLKFLQSLAQMVITSLKPHTIDNCDQLMKHICSNQAMIFKEDVKLFHQGFPESKSKPHMQENDLQEVLLDYEYRAKSIKDKLVQLRVEHGENPGKVTSAQ
jgi:hypothetical protein